MNEDFDFTSAPPPRRKKRRHPEDDPDQWGRVVALLLFGLAMFLLICLINALMPF